jgi:hypothetical protein
LIGGEERQVAFIRNAYAEIEKITGKNLLIGLENADWNMLRAVIYAGLKWGLYKYDGVEPRPKFNLLIVGDWMDDDSFEPDGAIAQFVALYQESLPKAKNVKAGEKPAS